jgi:hypothetical protein
MAISPDGKTLYPMLEGTLTTDVDQRRLRINEFDILSETYTGREWWYRLSSTSNAIGDLTAVSADSFLVIERDNGEGPTAVFKKIYRVLFDELDADGYLVKEEVVDLMAIADPYRLGGSGPLFTFPFQTIESVIPLSRERIGVLNDNNYPFSSGRQPGPPAPAQPRQPDPNEFIIIRLDRPLR